MFRKMLKVVEPMRGVVLSEQMEKVDLKSSLINRMGSIVSLVFYKWGFLIFMIGFLLGRAMILSEMIPFVLPFFATIFLMKREKAPIALLALIAGAITIIPLNGLYTFISILSFLILYRLFSKVFENKIKTLPFLVFGSVGSSKLVMIYFFEDLISNYHLLMAIVESGLSFILTMIFLQSVPIITERKRKHALKNEEIVCLIILLASIMTGTIGWFAFGMATENMLARYLVLIFAFVGGAAIGSTVGVVTGLILSLASVASLYQMSLLAFSGLLGGLLKEGNKFGVGIGLLIGSMLIGLYGEGNGQISVTVMESMVAILLFLATPRELIMRIAKYIPGTAEYWKEQQQYLRKFRDVTAGKVEQFSNLFQTLSNSFSNVTFSQDIDNPEQEVDYFLSNVTEKTCQMCFRKQECWTKNFNKTYNYMEEIMISCQQDEYTNKRLKADWARYCLKSDKVLHVIQHESNQYQIGKKLKQQLLESRRLVADQLLGVSKVMGDFAKEIQKERENLQMQEEQILDALRDAGVDIGHVEIFQLDEGNVDIEISVPTNEHGECEKVIAPMLSHILEEQIVVKKVEKGYYPNGHSFVSFGSTKQFIIETGIATVAKGGAWISGDSYSTMEIGSGKYAIAISDGMGNGERAYLESNETLQLLQNILQSGIEETVAIKSINSVLSLRSTDEIFSTLDLAMIDLQDASAKFLKIGSTPSFIKRGEKVFMIEASNLPMGIINEFDVDVVSEQLKAGDLLIMMSDGIFDGPKHVENSEAWMKRIVKEIKAQEPQEVADIIIEQVIRTSDNRIEDDMTVVVAEIKRNLPKWTTIPMNQTTGLRRKKAQ